MGKNGRERLSMRRKVAHSLGQCKSIQKAQKVTLCEAGGCAFLLLGRGSAKEELGYRKIALSEMDSIFPNGETQHAPHPQRLQLRDVKYSLVFLL